MRIQDVKIIRKPLVLAKLAEVDRLESTYWFKFPDGYREYVTRLGEGILGGTFVRIYPPWRIAHELDEWRDRIRQYWFWDAGPKVLPRSRAIECVIVGDTMGGDELIFHPSRRNFLYVLPRHSEKVFEAGPDLLSAIDWMCNSGKLAEPFSERHFDPFDSRKERKSRKAGASKGVSDPAGESFKDIANAAARWAKRHGVLRRATAQVKSPLKKLPPKQLQTKLRRQSLVFAPGEFEQQMFAVTYEMSDRKTRLTIATVEVQHMPDNTIGMMITPDHSNWSKLKRRYGGDTFDEI